MLTPAPASFVQRMMSCFLVGGVFNIRGFKGDSFGPFKFAGGALGHGRVDSTRAGGSTLTQPPPASSHIRHAPATASKARLTAHTNMHTHAHTHIHSHSCFADWMYGPTDIS